MFLNTEPLLLRTKDLRNFVLQEPLVYQCQEGGRFSGRRFRSRTFAITDGYSTPPEAWPVCPPSGPLDCEAAYSAIMHDAAYRKDLEELQADGTWLPVILTDEEADALIDECMESQGVPPLKRLAIFKALRLFGSVAFKEDLLAAPIQPGTTQAQLQAMMEELRATP